MIKLVSTSINKIRKPRLAKKETIPSPPINNETIDNVLDKIDNEGEAFLYQEDINMHTPIISFIVNKDNKNFYKIINKYDINHANSHGITMLHYAVIYSNNEVFDYLLKHGADTNLANKNNTTPLHTAVFKGEIETLNRLLEHGANVNIKSSYDVTALHSAYKRNHIEIIKILIKNGADRNAVDFCGCRPDEYSQTTTTNIKTRGRKKKIRFEE